METKFAPAERADETKITEDYLFLKESVDFNNLLMVLPNIVLVLNHERQVVFCNDLLLEALDIESHDVILGKRPGEVLRCVHATETEGGCGTTEFCRYCGAVRAILNSQTGKRDTQECRIQVKKDESTEALDLRVTATPIDKGGRIFTFFSILDISDQKRRQALERIFFHDVLNTANAVKSSIDLLKEADDMDEVKDTLSFLPNVTERLISEIIAQRELLKAENGELTVETIQLDPAMLLRDIVRQSENYPFAKSKTISMFPDPTVQSIVTDPIILGRVLGNMIKNALEASGDRDKVEVGYRPEGFALVRFFVRNKGVMPRATQMQIFQRSFSTKGQDRGIGTYSMKLLTERYLGGKVHFISNEEQQTLFWIDIPREIGDFDPQSAKNKMRGQS